MFEKDPSEKRSFLFFILIGFITACILSAPNLSSWVEGALVVGWCFFGLWRLFIISGPEIEVLERINILPARLINLLRLKKKQNYSYVAQRLNEKDILLWALSGLIGLSGYVFILSGQKLNTLLSPEIQHFFLIHAQNQSHDGYAQFSYVIDQLSTFFMMASAMIVAVSFSHTKTFVQYGLVAVLGFFIFFSVLVLLSGGTALSGLVQTPFDLRMENSGIWGGLFPYAVFVVVVFAFMKKFDGSDTQTMLSFTGMSVMGIMAFFDLFGMAGAFTRGLGFSAFMAIGLCWGAQGFYKASRLSSVRAF